MIDVTGPGSRIAPTDIQPGQVAASAALPLVASPGPMVSFFHRRDYAIALPQRRMMQASANVVAAVAPQVPTRSPNPYREVQARNTLTYGVPRTVQWSRAHDS